MLVTQQGWGTLYFTLCFLLYRPLKVSLKRPGVSEGGEETRDEGEGGEKKIPKLKVRIGSDSVGEVKVHSGSSGEAGVKVSRRLSQSSKTPDTEDESANRYVIQ